MQDISQIKDELNIILTDAKIVSFNVDEAKQCIYISFELFIIGKRFLFKLKNVGRIVSRFRSLEKTAVKFNVDNLYENLVCEDDSAFRWKVFNNASQLFITDNENFSNFNLVLNNKFTNKNNVRLSQDSNDGKQRINMLVWFEIIELFDENLNRLDIEIFINKFKNEL